MTNMLFEPLTYVRGLDIKLSKIKKKFQEMVL